MKHVLLLKTLLIAVILTLIGGGKMLAQETIYEETFGTTGSKTAVNSYTGWSSSFISPTSSTWKIANSYKCDIENSSGDCNAYGSSGDLLFTFGEKLSGYSNVKLSLNYRKGNGNTKTNLIKMYVSNDGGMSYGDNVFETGEGKAAKWYGFTYSIADVTNLVIKFTSSDSNFRIDDIKITGTKASTNPTADLTFNTEDATLYVGETLTRTASPETTGASITYKSGDESIATVDTPYFRN